MNEFEMRWAAIASAGHSAGRFRVYPDHALNFYVQYSLAGERELVIEAVAELLPAIQLPTFENFDVVTTEIVGGVRIGLTLTNGELAKSFSLMCYDLAERSKSADDPGAATQIVMRTLETWAELFKKRAGLTREQVLGLLGELLVLEALLQDCDVEPATLILGWRGQERDARDIGVNGARVEVKAQRSTSALKLRISSLEQLDDRGDQVFIALVRLSPSESGRSLVDVVNALQAGLQSKPLASLELDRKLALSGVSVDSAFSKEPYSVDDRVIFSVTSAFPRLVPGNVAAGITKAQYEIAGPPLDAHRSTWEALIGAIHG